MTANVIVYRDRQEAGEILGQELKKKANAGIKESGIVLSLPRGGTLIGAVIAREWGIPHDLIICRKIGAPYNAEVAIAALTQEGDLIRDPMAFEALTISPNYLDQQCIEQQKEINRRLEELRGNKPFPSLTGRNVILVDDGVATGLTIQAALMSIRKKEPKEIILAVPVGPTREIAKLEKWVDRLVCPVVVDSFEAVGQFYWDFHQVIDEEVRQALQ